MPAVKMGSKELTRKSQMRFSRTLSQRQNYLRERVAPPHRVKVAARARSWLNPMGEIGSGWQRRVEVVEEGAAR
jgi:hypothetical protein